MKLARVPSPSTEKEHEALRSFKMDGVWRARREDVKDEKGGRQGSGHQGMCLTVVFRALPLGHGAS